MRGVENQFTAGYLKHLPASRPVDVSECLSGLDGKAFGEDFCGLEGESCVDALEGAKEIRFGQVAV